MNPERFVFFHEKDFHIITYFKCMDGGDRNQFKEEILGLFIEKYDKVETYEISRSWEVEGALKESRLRGIEFDIYLHEVNHVYSDAAGKEYAIATKRSLVDKLNTNEIIKANYKLALDKINSDENLKDSRYIKSKLSELKMHNLLYISDAEIVKSTKHLIKKFNKQIKEKINN
jgi:hypothetical protein